MTGQNKIGQAALLLVSAWLLVGQGSAHADQPVVKTFEPSVAQDLDAVAPLQCNFDDTAEPTWFGFGDDKIAWANSTLVDEATGGEITLRYPWSYLVPLSCGNNATCDVITFRFHKQTYLPFRSKDAQTAEHKQRFRKGIRDVMRILVEYEPLDDLEAATKRFIRGRHQVDLDDQTSVLSVAKLSDHGLYAIDLPNVGAGGDIKFAVQYDTVSDLMSCRRHGQVPTPSCSWWFDHGDLSVRANVPLHELQYWQTHRRGIERLLGCFEAA